MKIFAFNTIATSMNAMEPPREPRRVQVGIDSEGKPLMLTKEEKEFFWACDSVEGYFADKHPGVDQENQVDFSHTKASYLTSEHVQKSIAYLRGNPSDAFDLTVERLQGLARFIEHTGVPKEVSPNKGIIPYSVKEWCKLVYDNDAYIPAAQLMRSEGAPAQEQSLLSRLWHGRKPKLTTKHEQLGILLGRYLPSLGKLSADDVPTVFIATKWWGSAEAPVSFANKGICFVNDGLPRALKARIDLPDIGKLFLHNNEIKDFNLKQDFLRWIRNCVRSRSRVTKLRS